MAIHKIVSFICLYNLNENMCKNIFQQCWNKEKYYWHFSNTNTIKFMHFGRTVLFKQTTTNRKDFSHIYLPCYFTWFTRPHLCFLTNAVLKKNPSSSPAQAVVNFPTLFFCTFAEGHIKCIFRQELLQTKSAQKLAVVFFSGLKEARKKMCLGCPTTGW